MQRTSVCQSNIHLKEHSDHTTRDPNLQAGLFEMNTAPAQTENAFEGLNVHVHFFDQATGPSANTGQIFIYFFIIIVFCFFVFFKYFLFIGHFSFSLPSLFSESYFNMNVLLQARSGK